MDRIMAQAHSEKAEEWDSGERIDRLVGGAQESADSSQRVDGPGIGTGFPLCEMGFWLWSRGPQTPMRLSKSPARSGPLFLHPSMQSAAHTKAHLSEPFRLSDCQEKALVTAVPAAGWFGG